MTKVWMGVLLCACATGAWAEQGVATTGKLTRRYAGIDKTNERGFFITKNGAHVLPMVADGGGWSTRFYFTNLENRDVKIFCEHVAGNGTALNLTTTIGTGDGAEMELVRYGTFTFATNGGGAATTRGWTYCYPDKDDDRIGAHVVLRQEVEGQPAREFTMPMLPDYQPKFLAPFPDRTAFRSELILVNTTTRTPSTIRVRLFTRNEVSIDPITLAPGEQRIINLTDQFNLVNFNAASLLVEVTEGTKFITGSLIRQSDTGGPVAFVPLAEFIE